MPFTCLEPAQVCLQPQHQALQQQPGLGPAGFRHRGALGVPQPEQQLAALRVHDRKRVGQPGRRGRDQLEVELGRAGPGQLTSASQSATRCWPAGVSSYTLRSGRSGSPADGSDATSPAFSSRVSVT